MPSNVGRDCPVRPVRVLLEGRVPAKENQGRDDQNFSGLVAYVPESDRKTRTESNENR